MKKSLFATVSAFGMIYSMPSYAQTVEAPSKQDDVTADRTESEILVIAQRREQNLQDVPLAISVFSDEDRDKLGIRTIQDMSNFTPGLSFSASLDRLSIRGVGRLTNIIGTDPGVATYNDGFYTASAAEASKTPMFVERVEVLRGPQGTLYGRNTIGGSLNVISKRPTDEFEGEIRATVESLGFWIGEGYLSGPITDRLKARVSVQVGPKFFDEPYENVSGVKGEGTLDRFLVEAQLQYDFSDTTELWLKYSHAEWDDHNRAGGLTTPYNTTDVLPEGLVPNAAFGYTVDAPGVTDPRKFDANTRASQKLSDNHNIVANFTSDLGGVTLKYIGGYSQYYFEQLSDYDFTSVNSVTTGAGTLAALSPAFAAFAYTYNPTYVQEYIEDKSYYSNEITLSNSDEGSFNWIVGLYQYHEDFSQPITQFVDGDGSDNLSAAMATPLCIGPGGVPQATCAANPRRAFYEGRSNLEINGLAAFGQADAEVADGLKVTVGLRYSRDEKKGDESFRLVGWDPTDATLDPAGCFGFGCGAFTPALDVTVPVLNTVFPGLTGSGAQTRSFDDSWGGLSWRLGVDYSPNTDTLIYASYARGIKSGGFNLGVYSANAVVDKEEVDAFEIGLKSRPAYGLTLNLAAFHYIYDGLQVPVEVETGGIGLGNLFNLPQSKSTGAEIESTWDAADWLEISANYAYLDARISETNMLFDDPNIAGNTPVDIDGNRLPASSKHKFAISGLIDVPISKGDLFLAGSYVYRSDAYYGVFDNPNYRAPGWDQVDLRVTYVTPNEKIRLIGYVRNLFDTLGYDGADALEGSRSSRFGQTLSYTPPRSFGAEVQFKF
jgi:iron complex outermembrane receptor protein